MLKKLKIEMRLALMGLASVPLALSMVATPAPAHEWFRWDRTLPYPYGERDPSVPNVGIAPANYRPVTRDINSYRPVDPLPWGDVNKRVSPIPKQPPKQEKAQ